MQNVPRNRPCPSTTLRLIRGLHPKNSPPPTALDYVDDSRLTSTISNHFRLIIKGGRLFTFWLQAEDGHYFLQVFPDFALRSRIAQQIRGVLGGDQFRAAEIKPLAAKTRDTLRGLQQCLRGATSQGANYFWPDYVNLA